MGTLQLLIDRSWEFGEVGTSLNILSEAKVIYLSQRDGVESLTGTEISTFSNSVII